MPWLRLCACLTIIVPVLQGCATITTKGPTTLTDPTLKFDRADQDSAALAFIAYVGDGLDYPKEIVDPILYVCIENELASQPLTKGKYELAWGPAVYRFDDARLDDNMMYVVRHTGTKNWTIAIRGTNFGSLSDWLYEDFYVTRTVPWKVPEKNAATAPPNPAISEATHIGLDVLKTMKPQIPGIDPTTVRDFLYDNIGEIESVTVTGHSLAGALAPAFALWLSDTRQKWDRGHNVKIKVTPIAGATGGNGDYSSYYDSQLGKSTRRLHNPFDIVPLAWNELGTLPGIYDVTDRPTVASGPERFLLQRAIKLAQGHDYTQISPDAPSLTARLMNTAAYIEQVKWQHHCGYYCGLNIADLPVTPKPLKPLQQSCPGTGSVHCAECPPQYRP